MGIICIILSAFCFAFMSVFVRLSGDLPTIQKTFFRNFIALFFALLILKKEHIPFRTAHKNNRPVIFVRALAGTIGMLFNFYAIDHMVLSDASMLNKMSPFFVIIFSFIFLKERLTAFQAITVICAFIGSLFIIKPSFSNVEFFPALIGFLGGMGAGLAYTCVRYLGQHGEKGAYIVAYFSAFSCIFCLPFMIADFHPMSLSQLLCLPPPEDSSLSPPPIPMPPPEKFPSTIIPSLFLQRSWVTFYSEMFPTVGAFSDMQ